MNTSEKKQIIKLDVYYKHETHKFYEFESKEELEEMYKSNKKQKLESMTYFEKDNVLYACPNPRYIKFIFPSSDTGISIFITDAAQISLIKVLYPDTKLYMKLKDQTSFVEMKDLKNREYSEIKIANIYDKNITEYKEVNVKIVPSELTLKKLSLISNDYLYIPKSGENIKFDLTKEREDFFKYLKNEIENSQFIPICGPESIGKTSTVLGFFSLNRHLYNYFYINLKTLDKYKGDTIKIKELIIKELYHCIRIENINKNIETIKKLVTDESNNPIKLISGLINKLELIGIYLIIDQYKITFDKNYNELKIIQRIANERYIHIILISSMNEEDVKDSIVTTLSNTNTPSIFTLDYIYVNSLVKCNGEDLGEEYKLLLKNYGNTYYYYFNILEEKKTYFGKNEEFEDYFDSKMVKYFEDRYRIYHNNIKDEILINNLLFLLQESDDYIPVQRFLENEKLIPFRFFNFCYNDKNIFKIKDIKLTDNIKIKFQCDKYIKFTLLLYQKLLDKIDDKIIKEKHYDLEQLFFIMLWASRKNPVIKGVNIIKILKIKSLFKIGDSLDIENMKENEAILFVLTDVNAMAFDTGILKKEKDGTFALYLFQVTKKKLSNERITYLMLNDYFNFFKVLFQEKLNINITKNYFSYVFDKSERDKATEDFLLKYDINYILLDKINLLNAITLKPYITKMQVINNFWLDKDDNNFYVSIDKDKNGKFDTCYDYLLKKRKIIQNINSIENIDEQTDSKNLLAFNSRNDKHQSKRKSEKSQGKLKNKRNKKKEKDEKFNENEISIDEDDNETKQIEEQSKKEINKKKDKTIKVINPIKKIDIKEIVKKIKEAGDYYNKVKEAYNKWNKYKTKFVITNTQKEKIISDYLIEVNDNIAGISYEIKDQLNFIKNFIKFEKQVNSLKNFLKLINKGDYDFIISCIEINSSSIYALCPEYNSYIINVTKDNELFYFDYIKRKRVNLENLIESDFYVSGNFYAVSFSRRNIINQELINYIKLMEELISNNDL